MTPEKLDDLRDSIDWASRVKVPEHELDISVKPNDLRELLTAYAERDRLKASAQKVLAQSYLDDDVLFRFSFTNVACAALRDLKAALEG